MGEKTGLAMINTVIYKYLCFQISFSWFQIAKMKRGLLLWSRIKTFQTRSTMNLV